MLTDAEAKKFYDSAVWQRKREAILQRDHYECQDCRQRLLTAAKTGKTLHGWERYIHRATQVHHIQELKDRPDLALADSNLISLCTMCHNIRHGRDPCAQGWDYRRKPKLTEEKW